MSQQDKTKETIHSLAGQPTVMSYQELADEVARNKQVIKERKATERRIRRSKPANKVKDNAKHREYMKKNAARLYPKQKQRYREQKLRAVEFMGGICADCKGKFHPAVYDFHHLDGSGKDMTTRRGWTALTWDKVVAELAKCIMLCANCHRIRHTDKQQE